MLAFLLLTLITGLTPAYSRQQNSTDSGDGVKSQNDQGQKDQASSGASDANAPKPQHKLTRTEKKVAKENAKIAAKEEKATSKIAEIRNEFPQLDEQHAAMIANHQIFIGMTVDMLRASWVGPLGSVEPVRVNDTYTANGLQQQAIYETLTKRIYVYIASGVVTSYQVGDR